MIDRPRLFQSLAALERQAAELMKKSRDELIAGVREIDPTAVLDQFILGHDYYEFKVAPDKMEAVKIFLAELAMEEWPKDTKLVADVAWQEPTPQLCAYCENNHQNPHVLCHARKSGERGCTCRCVPEDCVCQCGINTPNGTPPILEKKA